MMVHLRPAHTQTAASIRAALAHSPSFSQITHVRPASCRVVRALHSPRGQYLRSQSNSHVNLESELTAAVGWRATSWGTQSQKHPARPRWPEETVR